MHAALAHIVMVTAVWTAAPLGTVVRVTRLRARQTAAETPTRRHTRVVQHASKTHHSFVNAQTHTHVIYTAIKVIILLTVHRVSDIKEINRPDRQKVYVFMIHSILTYRTIISDYFGL